MPESRRALLSRTVAPPLLALAATGVALWSYTRAIGQLGWVLQILLLAAVLIGLGVLLRQLTARRSTGVRVFATLGVQLLALTMALTRMFAPEEALFGVIPSARTIEFVPALFEQAVLDVWHGKAPLDPSTPLVFSLSAIFGLLAIAFDDLLAHGRVIVAAAIVAGVGTVPLVGTAAGFDFGWFLLFGILTLILLRHSVRREERAPRPSPLSLAALVGALALAAGAAVGPGLPVTIQLFSVNQTISLNTSLNLGNDLRRTQSIDVISLATSAGSAPYLRLATLTQLEGQVWRTDDFPLRTIGSALARSGLPEGGTPQATSMRLQNVEGQQLPIPYPAIGIQGMNGEWRGMSENRTIVTRSSTTRDQDFTVISLSLEPTLEQMRADRSGGDLDPMNWSLPAELPANVTRLAREVTADAETDYDRLLALQSWFRSEFRYSLQTPVDEGFDGSGAEAVGAFLEVREGYCVHFAAAFTLMARSLGMPTRIVVGFLPGEPTGDMRGEETLYRIGSDLLHAWPEVHFEEWGWMPFEPTASLGAAIQPPSESEVEGGETPTAEPEEPTTAPELPTDEPEGPLTPIDPGQTPVATGPGLWWVLLAFALGLLLLGAPAILRGLRRRRRMQRAAAGDGAAAWREVEDTLVDLRLPIADAETIRQLATRLARRRGAATAELRRLADAAERAHYAASPAEQADLAEPLRRTLRALRSQADAGERVSARLFPRSLAPRWLSRRE